MKYVFTRAALQTEGFRRKYPYAFRRTYTGIVSIRFVPKFFHSRLICDGHPEWDDSREFCGLRSHINTMKLRLSSFLKIGSQLIPFNFSKPVEILFLMFPSKMKNIGCNPHVIPAARKYRKYPLQESA